MHVSSAVNGSYSASNAETQSKYTNRIMFDFYPGLAHTYEILINNRAGGSSFIDTLYLVMSASVSTH